MEGPSEQLEISQHDGAQVVRFADTKLLDEVSLARISDELTNLVASADAPRLVLDFEVVKHMSSSALGMLITLHKQVRERNGRVALCNIRPEIYKVFSITKLSEVFQIYESRDTAMAGVA